MSLFPIVALLLAGILIALAAAWLMRTVRQQKIVDASSRSAPTFQRPLPLAWRCCAIALTAGAAGALAFQTLWGKTPKVDEPPVTAQMRPKFEYFAKVDGSRKLIIFIHGLWGDPITSFAANKTSWPELMKGDTVGSRGPALATYSTATLGYPASAGDRLSIPHIASRLRQELSDVQKSDEIDELYFVAYSLGGVVLKEILRDEIGNAKSNLIKKTKAVFLVSVPSSGTSIADFADSVPWEIAPNQLVVNLKDIAKNAFLQSQQNFFQSYVKGRPYGTRFAMFCAYETKPLIGNTVVVPSAAGPCDGVERAENENHFTIAKPISTDSSIYVWVKDLLADVNNLPPSPLIQSLTDCDGSVLTIDFPQDGHPVSSTRPVIVEGSAKSLECKHVAIIVRESTRDVWVVTDTREADEGFWSGAIPQKLLSAAHGEIEIAAKLTLHQNAYRPGQTLSMAPTIGVSAARNVTIRR